MDLTAEQIDEKMMQADVGHWADGNKIKLQSGTFSFETREYQMEPLRDNVRRTCYMKATQLGFTEMEVLRSLHGLIYGRYPRGILYLFPTNDDVQEFGKSRFNPLILANRKAIGQYVKTSGTKGTDTASLKKIRSAFLWLRGARLTRKIDEQDESSKMRSISVDRIVFDELDMMADTDSKFTVIAKARGRMGDSELKEECFISNPTTPNFGIDTIFAKSDQRQWFRYCESCNKHTTCAEIEFFDNPEKLIKIRSDGTGYIVCIRCGRELSNWPGEWVPAHPENSDYMHGYQLSKLTSLRNDPAEILANYNEPPEGNLSDVIRLDLGRAHIAAEDKLRKEDVYNCCGDNYPLNSHSGPCIMGLDCMKQKHLIIGARTGRNSYEIYKYAVITGQGMESWNEIFDLCTKFKVKSGVIDIRPYEDAARAFQKRFKSGIWLCEYKETTPLGSIYNPNTGIVSVCRTEIMDASHRLIVTPGNLVLPRDDTPGMDNFVQQVCSPFKIRETNKKTQQQVYRYRKTTYEDHFRHALNYFLLAAKDGKVGMVTSNRKYQKRQTVANNNYARI
jgi:hypothetical protein